MCVITIVLDLNKFTYTVVFESFQMVFVNNKRGRRGISIVFIIYRLN